MPQSGRFITMEGGEGTGKTTQAILLNAALKEYGIRTLSTREPGGTPNAEEIRSILVTGKTDRWDKITETLLYFAARRDHMVKLIKPALNKGNWVVCDRFTDSTLAYQGYGHGVPPNLIIGLHKLTLGNFKPDLTLVFHMDVAVGIERAMSRDDGEDRYERMGILFHKNVNRGFMEIAKESPQRCVVVNAEGSIYDIHAVVITNINFRFNIELPTFSEEAITEILKNT